LIVAFVTVLGQVAVCVLAMLTRGADHLTVVWGMLWLAAPMVGMRMWLLSGEPASAGVSVSGG
jgi:hypothetical protein